VKCVNEIRIVKDKDKEKGKRVDKEGFG